MEPSCSSQFLLIRMDTGPEQRSAMQKTTFVVLLGAALWASTCCLITEYFLISDHNTWDDAQQNCNQQYNNLASVNNYTEMQQLLGIMDGENESWIGLNRADNHSEWFWSDGSTSKYQNWASNQPNECFRPRACVRVENQKFYDTDCNQTLPSVCSQKMREMVVVKEPLTWEEALVYCRTHYKDLVSLLSRNEMIVALRRTGAAPGTYWWTGLRYLGDRWMWVNGDPLGWTSVPLSQCPLQPFQCGALETDEPFQVSRDCEEQLGFICWAE
ncbi:hypothetical protein Z043-109738 [Arapaima gigas]